MTTIRATQAQQLADLMQRESAIAATTETVTIHGLDAVVVILDHVDREDDTWQSVHVIDYMGTKSVSLGNVLNRAAMEETT